MKILINASTVAIGGGLTVALNVLEGIVKANTVHDIYYVSPKLKHYSKFNDQLKWISVPKILLKRYVRLYFDWIWLPSKITQISPDWIYTLGNLPVRTKFKQAFSMNNPFYTVDNYKKLNLSSYDKIIHFTRKLFFSRRVKFLDVVFTQTLLQRKKLEESFSFNCKVIVIPNSNIILPQEEIGIFKSLERITDRVKLLVFSQYYPHKNLEILLEVALQLKEKGIPVKFILTVNPVRDKKASRYIRKMQKLKISEYFLNIGTVDPSTIELLYKNVDGLLLPTLLESFSSTYVDAMKYGNPILTSNLDFAKEICKDCAWYFDPYSAREIVNVIGQCFSSEVSRSAKIQGGKELMEHHPKWDKIVSTIFDAFYV